MALGLNKSELTHPDVGVDQSILIPWGIPSQGGVTEMLGRQPQGPLQPGGYECSVACSFQDTYLKVARQIWGRNWKLALFSYSLSCDIKLQETQII